MKPKMIFLAVAAIIIAALGICLSLTISGKARTTYDDIVNPVVREIAIKLGQTHNGDTRSLLIDSLGRAGRPAVPVLIELLENGSVSDMHCAARAVAVMGGNAHEAVPHLKLLLNHSNKPLSRAAANAIGSIGPPYAWDAVPEMAKQLLTYPDPDTRMEIALALANVGYFYADDAVPALETSAKDDNSVGVRLSSMYALAVIRGDYDVQVPRILEDSDSRVANGVYHRPKRAAADENQFYRGNNLVIWMGPKAIPALSKVAESTKPTDSGIAVYRNRAAYLIKEIEKREKERQDKSAPYPPHDIDWESELNELKP